MNTALVVDKQMCDSTHLTFPLVDSLLREFPGSTLFPAGEDYAKVVRDVRDRQGDFDCLIAFLRFRYLCVQKGVFDGIRLPIIMLEHDAVQNFMESSPHRGKWTEYLSDKRIDLIVVSGLTVCERLQEMGFPAFYLPKGGASDFLGYRNSYSRFLCIFGSSQQGYVYDPRKALFDRLKPVDLVDKIGYRLGGGFVKLRQFLAPQDERLPIHRLRFKYKDMPRILSSYSGLIICDYGLSEPMIKHFEASALGLVPIRDSEMKEEVERLGYKDGKSMILYETCDDLLTKLEYYGQHLDELHRIQDGAREAARANTWEARAMALREYLEGFLQQRQLNP